MYLQITRTHFECSYCKQMLPIDQFVVISAGYRKKREAAGISVSKRFAPRQYRTSMCRSCKTVYDKDRWQKTSPEQKRRLYLRGYMRTLADGRAPYWKSRSRAKLRGAVITLTITEWRELVSSNTCHWCGLADLHPSIKHVDHIVPLSLGGEHSRSNLVIACANCNTRRSWEQKTKYVKEREMAVGIKV